MIDDAWYVFTRRNYAYLFTMVCVIFIILNEKKNKYLYVILYPITTNQKDQLYCRYYIINGVYTAVPYGYVWLCGYMVATL